MSCVVPMTKLFVLLALALSIGCHGAEQAPPPPSQMYTTYLASMFRSIRFGINEAHGRGVAMQLNDFLDHGGVTVNADGTFAINPANIKQNVVDLTRDLMTLEAVGGYADAKQMIATLAVNRPPTQTILDRLKDVPVDIEPRFATADQLLSRK